MKNLFCVSAILFFSGTSILASPVPANNNPISEKKKEMRKERREEKREIWAHAVYPADEIQLLSDFPRAMNVSWTLREFEEATFNDGGIIKTAYYDSDNDLVGTTTDVTVSDLPLKAQEYIGKKYPGYKIDKVVFFDDNEANDTDMFIYNQSFEDNDNYFPVLTRGAKTIILKVSTDGEVSFFENYK